MACWAHPRRKIHDARLSEPARALRALAVIRRFYDIEKQAKELDAPPPEVAFSIRRRKAS